METNRVIIRRLQYLLIFLSLIGGSKPSMVLFIFSKFSIPHHFSAKKAMKMFLIVPKSQKTIFFFTKRGFLKI